MKFNKQHPFREKNFVYLYFLFHSLYSLTIFIAQHNMATYLSSNKKRGNFQESHTSALMIKNWCVAVGLFW